MRFKRFSFFNLNFPEYEAAFIMLVSRGLFRWNTLGHCSVALSCMILPKLNLSCVLFLQVEACFLGYHLQKMGSIQVCCEFYIFPLVHHTFSVAPFFFSNSLFLFIVFFYLLVYYFIWVGIM